MAFHLESSAFESPRTETAEIASVVPDCPTCRTAMRLAEIFAHPRFPRVEIVHFRCDCGARERRVVPHLL
jgi:hypothetical protein